VKTKKKKAYKPRPVRADNMSWIIAGFKPVGSVPKAGTELKLANLAALDALILGHGKQEHAHTLMEAFDMALWLAKLHARLGADWVPELTQARQAAYAMHGRGEASGRFLFTGPEMQAAKVGAEVHTQQLEECTVQEMEKAIYRARTSQPPK
jgi:hypothetical protein